MHVSDIYYRLFSPPFLTSTFDRNFSIRIYFNQFETLLYFVITYFLNSLKEYVLSLNDLRYAVANLPSKRIYDMGGEK